jgi:hypothetical protein
MCGGYMKNMVYGYKVNRTEELLHRIFDAERRINDPDVPLSYDISDWE